MTASRAGIKGIFLVLTAACMCGLSACQEAAPLPGTAVNDSAHTQQKSSVTVERSPITPVLTLAGTVVGSSAIQIRKPVPGQEWHQKVPAGEQVTVGQVIAEAGPHKVVAEVAGRIHWSPKPDVNNPALPLGVISTEQIAVQITLPPSAPVGFHLQPSGARIQLLSGSGVNECSWIGPAAPTRGDVQPRASTENAGSNPEPSTESAGGAATHTRRLICLPNAELKTSLGDQATVVVRGKTIEDAVVVPISAVAGRGERGTVIVQGQGEPQIVEVSLGAQDGARVQILAGITAGATIASTPYDLSAARAPQGE